MTHHDDRFFAVPAHFELERPAQGSEPLGGLVLPVRGQGTVGFTLTRQEPFTLTFAAPELWSAPGFRWQVGHDATHLAERAQGEWVEIASFDAAGAGLDPEPTCQYWFSIDWHNRRLGYGKGEMRLAARIGCHDLPPARREGADPYAWLADVSGVSVEPPLEGSVNIWRDPVTVEPPLRILPRDAITMDEMASANATVIENLTPECGRLYGNVAGASFVLDGPDFPDFSKAIQASIDNPDGWCYQTLEKKADEFGTPDPERTYLRITMGFNQGESPGIPFVMEIWPYQHGSPIHDHGGADAVIRVLHGHICVSLYPMLSPYHQEPYLQARFSRDDVTWITPTLNQVHMLHNDQPEACITIQCYTYAASDTSHYPYFDYIADAGIAQFTPNSDLDFSAFKQLMRSEWEVRREGQARA
jgi:hypothetical protein